MEFVERKSELSVGPKKQRWCVIRRIHNLVKADQKWRARERERDGEKGKGRG